MHWGGVGGACCAFVLCLPVPCAAARCGVWGVDQRVDSQLAVPLPWGTVLAVNGVNICLEARYERTA